MKRLLIFVLIEFIFLACSSNSDILVTDPNYAEYITEHIIDTEINFMAEEIYTTNQAQEPVLKLKLISSKIYPCINYQLSTTEFINGNELIVRFEQIIEPEVCLTAIGPATSYIELSENISKLTFLNGNAVDTYDLNINEQKISVTPVVFNFINSLYANTFRIPENSFAYVCGTNTDNTNIYTEFSAIIEQNPDFTAFEFEGEGRIPYPETTDGHYMNHPSKFYKYTDPSQFNTLANTLNTYASENIEANSGISIAIYGWNNINFYSWIEN